MYNSSFSLWKPKYFMTWTQGWRVLMYGITFGIFTWMNICDSLHLLPPSKLAEVKAAIRRARVHDNRRPINTGTLQVILVTSNEWAIQLSTMRDEYSWVYAGIRPCELPAWFLLGMHRSGFFRFGRTELNQAASRTEPNHIYL